MLVVILGEKELSGMRVFFDALQAAYISDNTDSRALLKCLRFQIIRAKDFDVDEEEIEGWQSDVTALSEKVYDGKKLNAELVMEGLPSIRFWLDLTNDEKVAILKEIDDISGAIEALRVLAEENGYLIELDIEGDEWVWNKNRELGNKIVEKIPVLNMHEDGESCGIILAHKCIGIRFD